jgi:hypothetical protein
MAKDKGLGLSDKPYYGHMILTEKNKWRNSVIRDVLYVLPKRDRQKITLVVLLQIFMGLLDLLGVAIIGVLGALAVSGVQSSQPGNRVSQFIEILHLSGRTFQEQAAFLGIAAASILAKVARDEYIANLCKEYPKLVDLYSIDKNKGYGTAAHMNGIKEHGITRWHRKSYGPCKNAELTF